MAAKKQVGLGRGLGAILDIGGEKSTPTVPQKELAKSLSSVVELELSKIDPNPQQPRTNFSDDSINELAQSIKSVGLIQPITVREDNYGRYTIISGERRFKASRVVGLESVPVYIRKAEDETLLEMALVENIQREDLNPMEIAISLDRLIKECSITQEVLSERIGKSRAAISNYIRLLRLPAAVQSAISNGVLSLGHAKVILSVDDDALKCDIAEKVIAEELSVRDTERLIKALVEANNPRSTKVEKKEQKISVAAIKLRDTLKGMLKGKVTISQTPKGESKVTFTIKDSKELERLLNKLS